MWDVFISHAWEDKEDVARPLAEALSRRGLRVWYDEFTLRVGDKLLRSIDHGLANSRYGVVILSPDFFAKEWAQKELAALAAKEVSGQKVILPVWHNITAERIREYSPILADRLAVRSDRGLEDVVAELLRVIKPPPELVLRVPLELPEMVLVPAGEFLMGSNPSVDKAAYNNEQPQHTLYLPDYYLSRTPVTNAQYAAFVQAAVHRPPEHWKRGNPPRGKEDHPVVKVIWHDAVAYSNWLAEVTGQPYRLPSEAEWEKGARGSDGRIWPWGNRWDAERCNSYEGGKEYTTPVGAYPQGGSPYGLLDMAGNVWEWTRSLFKAYPYDPEDGREDLQARDFRVLRGGSFYNNERLVRCAVRLRFDPNHRLRDYGFRVCVVSQQD